MRRIGNVIIASAMAIGLSVGCQKAADEPLDGVSGFVSRDQRFDQSVLIPNETKLTDPIRSYTIIERFVFIGRHDTNRTAVTATFRRVLKDNKFIRAERDFSGFVLGPGYWQALPYTKMRHDSTRLDQNYPFMFGGVEWTTAGKSGALRYNWRGMDLAVEFSGLVPRQHNRHGNNSRAHGVGSGRFMSGTDTTEGTLFYELIQIDGFNAVDSVGAGIEFSNYDWIALSAPSGATVIAAGDSTTAGDRILKNFVAVSPTGAGLYAEGDQYVRISSDEIRRDPKIAEWLANRKILNASDLGVAFDVRLGAARVFYSSGFALTELEGTLTIDGQSEPVWGVLEHWQQPKSDPGVLK